MNEYWIRDSRPNAQNIPLTTASVSISTPASTIYSAAQLPLVSSSSSRTISIDCLCLAYAFTVLDRWARYGEVLTLVHQASGTAIKFQISNLGVNTGPMTLDGLGESVQSTIEGVIIREEEDAVRIVARGVIK